MFSALDSVHLVFLLQCAVVASLELINMLDFAMLPALYLLSIPSAIAANHAMLSIARLVQGPNAPSAHRANI